MTRLPSFRTWFTSRAVVSVTLKRSGGGASPASNEETPACKSTGAKRTPRDTSSVTSRSVNGRAALGISALPGSHENTVWYESSGQAPDR